MVIVMMGVLAVFAAPRLFDSTDFYARGFALCPKSSGGTA